jgi:hypothetical protein
MSWIRTALSFANRILPLIFAAAYLACVPVFAWLYGRYCSNGFYAPYAHLESKWKDKEKETATRLLNIIMRQEGPMFPPTIIDSIRGVLSGPLTVTDVSTDGRLITFHASGTVRPPLPLWWYWPKVPSGLLIGQTRILDASLSARVVMPRSTEDEPLLRSMFFGRLLPVHGALVITIREGSQTNNTVDLLFPRKGAAENEHVVGLRGNEAEVFKHFIDEYNGLSSGIGEDRSRMLYLSVVVVTTLGLGDIVPLSDEARAFVGGEAIAGIILVGLFFWSIARSKADPPAQPCRANCQPADGPPAVLKRPLEAASVVDHELVAKTPPPIEPSPN